MKPDRRFLAPLLAAAAFAGLLAMLYLLWGEDARDFVQYALGEGSPPVLFLVLFAVLPLFGFPVSAFLVLLGVRFGIAGGLAIMIAGMAFHLLAAFWIVHSFLRSLVLRLLRRMDYRLPQVPEDRVVWFSFVFMAVPGLSYCLKNYVLPLAGVPLRHFFLAGFLMQGAMGVPFVIAGDALATESLLLLAVGFVLLLAGYALVFKVKRRRAQTTADAERSRS